MYWWQCTTSIAWSRRCRRRAEPQKGEAGQQHLAKNQQHADNEPVIPENGDGHGSFPCGEFLGARFGADYLYDCADAVVIGSFTDVPFGFKRMAQYQRLQFVLQLLEVHQ